ncbi:prostatic acid phosphatase [Echinops telfairi]|uniref:acid phosphatase n=1 Tax=Echinops telfairi TaxID=9371 RepID=A0ABM0INN8_ECHTE|nr:prostatic acid phosphatase [Echinops telfairi]
MRAGPLLLARAASLGLSISILLSCWLEPGVAAKELKFVTLLFRHGDRSPIETFPNDPIKESAWPQGFGQLTQVGMEQHYKLGEYLRRRYETFLNESYKREQVYVQSTDVDRTLMSAMANLAALFPPEGISIWNPNLPWQPIPVHTVPVSEDKLLYLPFKHCPRFKELEDETLKTEEFQKRLRPYKDFIEMLPTFSGYQGQDLFGIWSRVYDPLFCERTHNFTLPSWVTEDIMAKLRELSGVSLVALAGVSTEYSVEMYYRNESQHEPYPLTLPGCTHSCPLEKFAELLAPIITDDWDGECMTTAVADHQVLKVVLAIAFCLVVSVLALLLFTLIRHGPCWKREYSQDF